MTHSEAQTSFNFSDLLSVAASAVPERPAIVCDEQVISFGDLRSRVASLAAYLDSCGLKRGDTVGLQLNNCPAFLVGFFATCSLGAVPFNINFRYVGPELEHLYENSNMAALLHHKADSPQVDAQLATGHRLKARLCIDEAKTDPLSDEFARTVETQCPGFRTSAGRDDDLVIIYTGGTTGFPKGVMWPHKSLFFGALGGGGWYHPDGPVSRPSGLTRRIIEGPWLRVFPVAPLIHGAALWTALGSLLVGHTIVLAQASPFSAANVWSLAEKHQVNIMAIVGDAMALPLVEALENQPGRWDLKSLNHVGSGGAIFSPHLRARMERALPQASTSSSMGTTETGTMGPGDKSPEKGIMHYSARPDLAVITNGRLAEPEEHGVIARRGYLPIGYYGDTRTSRETFLKINGVDYALGGDAAVLNKDGSIDVLGRGSTCINPGGEKVYPEEVEQILKSHSAIRDALVVAANHPRWGQQVAAVVSLAQGAKFEKEDIQAHCRKSLAGYKVPRQFVTEPEIRRSVAGKPDYSWARTRLTAQS